MPKLANPLRVDLAPEGLRLNRTELARALRALPDGAPVVALIHGFSFMPDLPGQCPHQHILSLNPSIADGRAISWPRHLGLDGCCGLALACGWPARGSVWRVHDRAALAGRALADLAALVASLTPGRRLDVLCHSMGARVALSALLRAPPAAFGRMILLAAAETRTLTRQALASPAGRTVEVVNVATRENDLFDAMFEWLLHGGRRTSVGQGLADAPANWRDLWLDRPETLAALAHLGHSVAPPLGRVSHWSPYLRPGVFSVYRALLAGTLPLQALPQARPTRRWSRLVAWQPIGRRMTLS
jgi:pimeloyl-ACP methyl ester carboxylesterase